MKTLITINGLSGSGKSTALSILSKMPNKNHAIIKQFTTRKKRPYEKDKTDIDMVTLEQFNSLKLDYTFKRFSNYYGLSKIKIDTAFEKADFAFIILGEKILTELIRDYKDKLRIITVVINTNKSIIENRIKLQKLPIDQENNRLKRMRTKNIDYNKYMFQIENNGSLEEFERKLIHELIPKFTHK